MASGGETSGLSAIVGFSHRFGSVPSVHPIGLLHELSDMVSSQQLQSSGKPRGKDNMLGRTALLTLMGLSMAHLPAAAETIRIACQDNFPPFVDVKDGKPVGLVVDILTAAAARENFEVQFVLVPFDQVQGTLDDGRAQAIVPLAITPERQQTFDFSVPILMTGGAFFVRAPNPTPQNVAALLGKIVVTPRTGPLVPFCRRTVRA